MKKERDRGEVILRRKVIKKSSPYIEEVLYLKPA